METYIQDDSGQWWCQTKRQRMRATEQTCQQCRRRFPNRHPQKFCSAKCRQVAQRGVIRRPPSTCEWCGKTFMQQPRRSTKCCSKRCAYDLGNTKRGRKGELNGRWKGGIRPHSRGYIREYVPGRGHLLQHRVVMEQILGRPLLKGEQVHHKNGVRHDNRPENLELWRIKQPPGQRATEQRHCASCTCPT